MSQTVDQHWNSIDQRVICARGKLQLETLPCNQKAAAAHAVLSSGYTEQSLVLGCSDRRDNVKNAIDHQNC